MPLRALKSSVRRSVVRNNIFGPQERHNATFWQQTDNPKLVFPQATAGKQVFYRRSPEIITKPVVTSVSHATRPVGSSRRISSRMASEIWSAILSG